jgi:hypothetical protein
MSLDKLSYAYLLTPANMAEKATLSGPFFELKMTEHEKLRGEIETVQLEAVRPNICLVTKIKYILQATDMRSEISKYAYSNRDSVTLESTSLDI